MRYELVVQFDSCAKVYSQLMTFRSIGQAMRSIEDEVNRNAEDNILFQHPSHFAFYHIGSYDDEVGEVSPIVHICLGTAIALKRSIE